MIVYQLIADYLGDPKPLGVFSSPERVLEAAQKYIGETYNGGIDCFICYAGELDSEFECVFKSKDKTNIELAKGLKAIEDKYFETIANEDIG